MAKTAATTAKGKVNARRMVTKAKSIVRCNSKLGKTLAAARLEKVGSQNIIGKRRIKTTINKKAKPLRAAKHAKPSARLAAMKCVVINLKSRADRWLGLQKVATKNTPWLQMERLDAVDGRVAPPPAKDVCKEYSTERLAKLFHWYRRKTIAMSGGERGCCASHLKAWRLCVSNNQPLIVLEDDAIILPCFTATIDQALKEAPKDVGALWLTSKDRGIRKRVGEVIMQPSYLWTTVGYIIWPAAAQALINLLPMDLPVDNFMAWHIKENYVKGFSVQPACVRQANTWNIGSDVPHSDDVALWNHPSNN